ncbi:hypothetical protein VTJ04DRAFT_2169 [Mycothermus thermophilus]|uniref:uncharacterized protein n=1 Tax=Humicola insolens TaxID=85995 RepID=UPI003742E28F
MPQTLSFTMFVLNHHHHQLSGEALGGLPWSSGHSQDNVPVPCPECGYPCLCAPPTEEALEQHPSSSPPPFRPWKLARPPTPPYGPRPGPNPQPPPNAPPTPPADSLSSSLLGELFV